MISKKVTGIGCFENPAECCRLCKATDAGKLFIYHCKTS